MHIKTNIFFINFCFYNSIFERELIVESPIMLTKMHQKKVAKWFNAGAYH